MTARSGSVDEELSARLEAVLARCYGLDVEEMHRIDAGTATDNVCVVDHAGDRWFVKVYRLPEDLTAGRDAIALGEHAWNGGVPVSRLRRTTGGAVMAEEADGALSVWEFVQDARTAEGLVHGDGAEALGETVARLHRVLAHHPRAAPGDRPATGLVDLGRTISHYDRVLDEHRVRRFADPDQWWALEALARQRALLPTVAGMLERLPPLTTQVLHGDLAAPNVLMRGSEVAAVLDFQPPSAGYMAWEIARIGADPRTVLIARDPEREIERFLSSYRAASPPGRQTDAAAVLAVGAAYVLASTYPHEQILRAPQTADGTLRRYGRDRHRAALMMLRMVGVDPS